MSGEVQPHYYMNIPAYVWDDEDLLKKPKAILLYGHISTLANQKGYCWATNKYFMNRLKIKSSSTITGYLNLLVDKGYIKKKKIYKDGTKQIEKRIISIDITNPIPTKWHTPMPAERSTPTSTERNTPMPADWQENNIKINNTSNNKLGCYVTDFYEKNIGFLAPTLREDIEYEIEEWNQINSEESEKIIVEALKNAIGAQASNKWKYARSILNSWKEKNIKSLSDIEADDIEHRKKMELKYGKKKSYMRKPREEKMPYWFDDKNNNQVEKDQESKKETRAEINKLMEKINGDGSNG